LYSSCEAICAKSITLQFCFIFYIMAGMMACCYVSLTTCWLSVRAGGARIHAPETWCIISMKKLLCIYYQQPAIIMRGGRGGGIISHHAPATNDRAKKESMQIVQDTCIIMLLFGCFTLATKSSHRWCTHCLACGGTCSMHASQSPFPSK
jgi:hypothetical protein